MSSNHTLIIGGTRGIGLEMVKEFASQGHRVSFIGRRAPSEPLDPSFETAFWQLDVLDINSLSDAWPEIARGGGSPTNIVFAQRFRGEGDEWSGEIETGLTATRNVIEFLASGQDVFSERSIVIISSVASQFVISEQPIGYHVAKAAIDQLVRYYAVTLGPKGFRINSISSGAVIKEESREFYRKNEVIENLYKEITPLGRMATSKDIAGVAWFLCNSSASFITGQSISLDGGLSLIGHQSLARKLSGLDKIETTQRPSPEIK